MNLCSGLRWGRFRTRSQSGISVVTRPSVSSASPHADGGLARPQQGQQRVAGRGGPRHGQRRAFGQPGQRARCQRQPGLRGGRGGPQHRDRVMGRVGRPGQHHLAVLFHHSVRQRAPVGRAAPQPPRARPAAQPIGLAEGVIDRVDHGPRGAGRHA